MLQSPLKSVHWSGVVLLTQGFGENRVDFYRQMGMKGHNGIDMYVRHYDQGFAPVYAAHDGYVISDAEVQSDTAGRFVKILSDELEMGGRKCKLMTLYFHLKEAKVGVKDDLSSFWYWKRKRERFVEAGQLIGVTDNTGRYTTGAHLHFGVYILWKKEDGSYQPDKDNGYDGAVDPVVYLRDDNVYLLPLTFSNFYYYQGKVVSRKEADKLIPAHLQERANSWSISVWKFNQFLRSLRGIKQ